MAKNGAALKSNPSINFASKEPLPVTKTSELLCTTEGDRMELMTRLTSPMMANAIQISFILAQGRGSNYVAGRCNQLMRLAVSKEGQGRRDLIDALQAAGKVPDAYYAAGGSDGTHREFFPVDE